MRHHITDIKAWALILFAFGFHNIVKAQCPFEVKVETVQNSTCISNGIVKVTLSGNDIDLSNVLIVLTNGGSINEQSSENGHLFETLPPGTYKITAQSVCKNNTQTSVTRTATVTVTSEYEGLIATLSGKRNSLTCINSGMIMLNMTKGKPPYKITLTSAPDTYTGETVFTASSPGSMQIGDLVPGKYSFTISDACQYSTPVNETINKISSDFPSNPYDEYFYPSGCDKAHVNANSEKDTYWNNEYRDFYEVAFTFDDTKNWTEALSSQQIDLAAPYKDLYNNGAKMKVYLRLKGTNCEQLVDEIQFSELSEVTIASYSDKSCDNYNLYFYLSNESSFCQPFKWEIFDESNTLLDSKDNLTSFNTQSIENLSYNKTYAVKVTDKNGSVVLDNNISYSQNIPSLGGYWVAGNFPFTYNLFYDITQICLPYKIEIYDDNETLLTTVENINRNADTIHGLEYDKLYKIKIIDNSGNSTEFDYSSKKPDSVDGVDGFTLSCENYTIRVDKPVNIKTPYTWTVYDKNGKVVLSGDDADNSISDLLYNTDYTVTFTDGVTTTTYSIQNGVFTLPEPELFDITERNYQCDNFELHFMVENVICFPYKLEVSDSDGNSVFNESDFMEPQYHSITLEYNKTYNIKVTDLNGIETPLMKDGYRLDREQSALNFQSNHYISECVSESHKGYMYISGQLDNGTSIHFLSGPQTPVHADTVLHESIYEFYPFSQDYRYSENVVIETGDYVFEVAKCGNVRTVTIPYKRNYEARDFSYTMGEVEDPCSGKINIFPKGQVYSGDNMENTWFVMVDCPVDELKGQAIRGNDPTSYFSLSAPGRYVIGISRYSYDCAIDTIIIDHGGEQLGLDGRSSYVCEIGTIGHIRVQAKNGKQPYTYTLLELNGTPVAGIEPNNTGAFDYGAFGEKYIVRVQDACNKAFPIEVQINTLDQTTLLSGNTVYCKDATIELSCLLLGATKYEWSGPLGFSANTRSISIPNVTPEHSGEYSILVEPAGCVGQSFPATIPITVPDVPAPEVSDPYVACADASKRLSIQSAEGHSIQWYDANENPLSDAPFVNFDDGAEEYIFYVTQTSDAYGECVSEKTKVNVISTPMPEKDATATGWSCENGNPEITVTNMVADYVYSVFAGTADNDTIIAFHGIGEETMKVTLPTTVADNTAYYLQTATLAGCASDERKTTPIEVNKLYINPEKLLQYSTNVDYEQTLVTNALSPAFTVIGGELPDGLSLSLSGIISGKPLSSKHRTNTFTVQVTDAKGCKVDRVYTLNGDVFVPKIFTPNGDEVNDVFMPGCKIVIFDRLGIEIFRGDNGWDGSYKGKLVAPDIYFYIVEYVDESSADPPKTLTGYVGVHY